MFFCLNSMSAVYSSKKKSSKNSYQLSSTSLSFFSFLRTIMVHRLLLHDKYNKQNQKFSSTENNDKTQMRKEQESTSLLINP